MPNLLGIEFAGEVGHADLILLEHMADPYPQLLVAICLHIGLVKDRRLLFLAEGSAKEFLKGQSRMAAFRPVAVGAETIIEFVAWGKNT